MSITTSTINVRGNLSACKDIPYIKYFELCLYENWSLHHYVSLIIDNYKLAEKDRAHQKARKRRREQDYSAIINTSAKKQYIESCFCPSVDVPLQADGSVDILETVKSTVHVFDQKIITLGSSRSYKSSNHLLVDSEQNVEVPRESLYDAEMYRILVN
ncbi:8397_t:CDS:2 [Funneliformis caledonium]|uniref:8397_t:CDS:1 n=1 Tax=Funneliformis caledonium TaxID=1117310 RepID=A0A9N9A2V6_9GLOM|nr:8397_t:CDS:2 [Funneliformis caledonium]